MRTTLTIDDEVMARLKEQAARSGRSFKATVNACLRLGLSASDRPSPEDRFEVESRALEARPGIEIDNIGELLEQIEGPAHR